MMENAYEKRTLALSAKKQLINASAETTLR